MKNKTLAAVVLALWAAAAGAAGAFHAMAHVPPPLVGVVVASLTVAAYAGLSRTGLASPFPGTSATRRLVALHLVRFVGAWFLWLGAQGRIPAQFADRAGWGDLTAAAGAGILLMLPWGALFRAGLLIWSVEGIVDLVVAVGTAAWLTATKPGSMNEIAGLPLTLVPLFVVPILLAIHAAILRGIFRPAADPAPGAPYCTS